MEKSNQQYFATIAVLVVLVALIWNFKTKPANNTSSSPTNNSNVHTEIKKDAPATTPSSAEPSLWTGTLKKSDNSSKGNLMLVTKERTIYIHSSRDWSALMDKEVNVKYEGSLQGFTLIDITAQ